MDDQRIKPPKPLIYGVSFEILQMFIKIIVTMKLLTVAVYFIYFSKELLFNEFFSLGTEVSKYKWCRDLFYSF